MLRQKSLKLMLFVTPAILLIGTLCVYAVHDSDYVGDPSLYYSVGLNGLGFSGRTSNSEHRYAIENYSKYDLEVTWEYAHKIILPNKSLFRDVSKHGIVTVKKYTDKYAAGTRSTTLPPGSYYIDAYTSVDIKYKKRRAGHSKRIKYAKAPDQSSVELLQ